jgi:hypothetical protein
MAVWMQIVGKKISPETINERIEECKQVLKSIELDLTFLWKTLENEFNNKLKQTYWSYNRSNWIKKEMEGAIALYYPLYEDITYESGAIRIFIYEDRLSITGPFDHFSHYWNISQEEPLRSGYQNIVRQICKEFGVTEVVYFSEWCSLPLT